MALGTLETSKVERVPQYAAGPVFITQRQCSRAPAGWWSIAAIVGSAGRGRVYRDVRAWPGRAPPSTVRGFRQPAASAPGPGHTETSTVIARRPADPDTRRPQPTVRTGRATVRHGSDVRNTRPFADSLKRRHPHPVPATQKHPLSSPDDPLIVTHFDDNRR